MRNQDNDRPLKREKTPQSEMEVLKQALFGRNKHDKTPINSVVPSGHLDTEEIELMHLYNDLYNNLDFLGNKTGLTSENLSESLLEKIASMSHFSKAEDGFAAEMLITRKSQQFQAMKQKNEMDTGRSLREELMDEISSRGDNTGSELTSPDPSW